MKTNAALLTTLNFSACHEKSMHLATAAGIASRFHAIVSFSHGLSINPLIMSLRSYLHFVYCNKSFIPSVSQLYGLLQLEYIHIICGSRTYLQKLFGRIVVLVHIPITSYLCLSIESCSLFI